MLLPGKPRKVDTAPGIAFGDMFSCVERAGPTYTVDTLRDLLAVYGEAAELFFITGADASLQLNFNDDLVKGACISHGGEILHERLKNA